MSELDELDALRQAVLAVVMDNKVGSLHDSTQKAVAAAVGLIPEDALSRERQRRRLLQDDAPKVPLQEGATK